MNKTRCPLKGNCFIDNVIYKEEVNNNEKLYIGAAELR